MKTKPDKIIDVFKLILVYSYCIDKNSDEIIMNQNSFADFLGISTRSVIRHFNLAKELGFITVVSRCHIYNKDKRSTWPVNIYEVDYIKLNDYILDKTGYNVLNNIDKEVQTYYNYMNFIKKASIDKYLSSLSEEELEEYESKELKIQENKEKQLDTLKEENKYFIDLLKEVNNEIIPLYYLESGKKRLVNILCATKNPDSFDGSNRLSLLHKFFGTEENIVEFDTNASIYRLSYALGNGVSADPNIDMYKLIFDECGFDLPWTKEFRVNFKNLLMPIYMRESSIKYRSLVYNSKKDWTWFANKKEGEACQFYKYLETELDMDIYDIFKVVKNAMHKIFKLKKFYKADIFIYESNLHILMLKEFKDLGIKTINVYDGFYFIEGTMTQELYNEIYEKCTQKLLNIDLHNTPVMI